MQIKEVKPITFLFFRTVTQLKDLIDYLPVGQELFREAVQNKAGYYRAHPLALFRVHGR